MASEHRPCPLAVLPLLTRITALPPASDNLVAVYPALFLFFQLKIFGSPWTEVTFMLVWLADQLNSLVTVILDVEYLICFYLFLIPESWNIDSKRNLCSPLTESLDPSRVSYNKVKLWPISAPLLIRNFCTSNGGCRR